MQIKKKRKRKGLDLEAPEVKYLLDDFFSSHNYKMSVLSTFSTKIFERLEILPGQVRQGEVHNLYF